MKKHTLCTLVLSIFVMVASAFGIDTNYTQTNIDQQYLRTIEKQHFKESQNVEDTLIEDSMEEDYFDHPSPWPIYGDTCYEITPEDCRYKHFGKSGVYVRDTINQIFEYKDIRFFWDGWFECFLRIPKESICTGVYDGPGFKNFILKDAGISIHTYYSYDLFKTEMSRKEEFQNDAKMYSERGTLLIQHFDENTFIFGGLQDSSYFKIKQVYFTNSENTDVCALLEIDYPERSKKIAEKIISEIFPKFPFKPF